MSKSAAGRSDATISQKIKALNEQMEQHAETGEWRQVTEAMVERNAMLPDVPLVERSSTYLSTQQSTYRVLQLAEAAQSEVRNQIIGIQLGRVATDSYRKNS